MVRSVFGDYMMFLDAQPYVYASDTPEIKNVLRKIREKGFELQRAIQKANKTRLGDDDKLAIKAKYEEEDIDGDRKLLVDQVNKLRDINMKKVRERDQKEADERKKMMEYVPEIKPKKVVAKKVIKAPAKKVVAKVMKAPAKKKMMKMVANAKKDIMKKSMKKPIAYGNVLTALTGKRPRKAPAKPKQVARFYVGGNVLPKGQKVAMPKKTTTTMKARKPMSAETKLKIKQGVQKYHKKCKEAMSMHSKMKR